MIELPPLAERRGDVSLLAQALLEEQNARGGRQLGGFAPDALDRLCAYPWPGNLAELAEVVVAAHARAGALVSSARTCPAAFTRRRNRRTAAPKHEPIQLDEFIARIEGELIHRALARSKGNKAKVAAAPGPEPPAALSADAATRLD